MSHKAASDLYDKQRNTGFQQRTAQVNARHVLPHIKPHHRILDIGCGPGSITADLAELVPQGQVIGVDRNADSIQTAASLCASRGLTNLSFQVADVPTDLANFDSESFDIVHAHQVLLHLSDALETMKQMRRLLKPGGVLSTVDSAFRVIIPQVPGMVANEEAYERLARRRGADPNFGQRHHIVANQAGFAWDDMEMSSWAMEVMSRESKARMAEKAPVTADMFVAEGIISQEEAAEHVKGVEEWSALPEARWLEVASTLICWKR